MTQEYDWAIFHLTIGKKFLLLHKSNTGRQERIIPKITQKGQVTIPKKIRECMGLRLDSQVDFQICQGKCILRKVIRDDYLEKWAGHLKIDKTTDQIVRELRGQ